MMRRTYGGHGRHALPSLAYADGTEMVTRVKGSADDVRKVLSRHGVPIAWMDSLAINEAYVGRHRDIDEYSDRWSVGELANAIAEESNR